jgi:hypothetical protein
MIKGTYTNNCEPNDFISVLQWLIMSFFSRQVIIEGITGSSYKGDIAIDDISFTPECQPKIGKSYYIHHCPMTNRLNFG